MIGRIKGIIIAKAPPDILVDVQGVGYELQVPMSTFYRLPELNQSVTLVTHLVVREDAHLLYGFYDAQERALFRALIKVSGVGPKLGLTILSGIEARDFVRVVRNKDIATLEQLPGIGRKTAERLLVEMRDKLNAWDDDEEGSASMPSAASERQAVAEAESALVALGYKPKEASRAVKLVADADLSGPELIRQALKIMVKS